MFYFDTRFKNSKEISTVLDTIYTKEVVLHYIHHVHVLRCLEDPFILQHFDYQAS